MSHSTTFSRNLHEIVEKGFPVSDYHKELLKGDLAFNLEIEVAYESMGSSGNGWDDPGEGAECYISAVTIDPPIDSLIPLTQEQMDWLESHIQDDAQQWAADSSNWYDPADDY